jgi:hypothetical protein
LNTERRSDKALLQPKEQTAQAASEGIRSRFSRTGTNKNRIVFPQWALEVNLISNAFSYVKMWLTARGKAQGVGSSAVVFSARKGRCSCAALSLASMTFAVANIAF